MQVDEENLGKLTAKNRTDAYNGLDLEDNSVKALSTESNRASMSPHTSSQPQSAKDDIST